MEFSTSDDRINARNFDELVPFFDRMHFAIAERCGAEYLMTNDRHFDKLKNNVKIIKPNLL